MFRFQKKSIKLETLFIISFFVFASIPIRTSQGSQALGSRFCLVPVANSAPTKDDLGKTFRIVNASFVVPGLHRPVFTPYNRSGRWTISNEPSLVPYDGKYPASYLDSNLLVEPWSGRAILGGNPIMVKAPHDSTFKEIDIFEKGLSGFVSRPFLLSKRHATAVIIGGEAYTIDGNELRPLIAEDDSARYEHHGFASLNESEFLKGVITSDQSGKIVLFADDGSRHDIGAMTSQDEIDVIDLSGIGTTVISTRYDIFLIRRNDKSSGDLSVTKLRSESDTKFSYPFSKVLNQVVHYDPGSFFFRRGGFSKLGRSGFEVIPGGDVAMTSDTGLPLMQELTTLGKMVIKPNEGLFTYDGKSLTRVPGSGPADLGPVPFVYDLTAIRRTFVASEKGLFQLKPDNHLVALPLPFDTRRSPATFLIDWPDARVAVIGTPQGLFVIDDDLRVDQVSGGENFKTFSPQHIKPVPGSGELVVFDDKGIDIIVDTRRSTLRCQ